MSIPLEGGWDKKVVLFCARETSDPNYNLSEVKMGISKLFDLELTIYPNVSANIYIIHN